MKVVKVKASRAELIEMRERKEAKFLNPQEVHAFMDRLKLRRNPSYFDCFVFMIAIGPHIREVGTLTESDFDFKAHTVHICKALKSHDRKVEDFLGRVPKTPAAVRTDEPPEFAIVAVKRCIARNKTFDAYAKEHPSSAFHESKAIFRTEYGSPITSHSFREMMVLVNKELKQHCEEWYGFKWTKNCIPHSLRHINISVLRSDPLVSDKEVQARAGHENLETTNGYTHQLNNTQANSVIAISKFMKDVS